MNARLEMKDILLSGARRGGKTRTMMLAAKQIPNAVVLVHSVQLARDLQEQFPGVTVLSRGDIDRLKGVHRPILLDHHYSEMLWAEREQEIDVLMSALRQKLKEDTE